MRMVARGEERFALHKAQLLVKSQFLFPCLAVLRYVEQPQVFPKDGIAVVRGDR